MKSYRTAFGVALVFNLLLSAGLFILWRRMQRAQPARAAQRGSNLAAVERAATDKTDAVADADSQAPAPAETPLVAIQLTPQRLQSIGVKTGLVEMKTVQEGIRAVGNVEVDEELLAYVQVRFPGWIQKVFANSTYQYVRKGEPLFTIYSPDLVTTEQEYLLAKQNQNLLGKSSVPGVASGSASLLSAAAERLKQWQVPAREIAQLEATGKVRQELEIDSPVSGYITERNALPNLYVQPETRLYTIADLSTVWVNAEVFQNDIGRVKIGDAATLTTDAYPARTFLGHANYILPQVDMTTRTIKVRLVFSNADLKLKPGMFVNVLLQAPVGRQLVIPASGVFQSGASQVAFVDRGGGYIEPRAVELGTRAGDDFIVLKGLRAGERIVTSANFLIDSESQLQAALGSFAPPPPGAGGAAAMSAPSRAPQATLEFTTRPSPPHKGANTFHVKLTSGGGPVAGAVVTVTFFMPAMPAMGMAAMKTVATLTDKGGGDYEGSGTLESGGTWQVTILAQKNGQTIATRQFSVSAEGGM